MKRNQISFDPQNPTDEQAFELIVLAARQMVGNADDHAALANAIAKVRARLKFETIKERNDTGPREETK